MRSNCTAPGAFSCGGPAMLSKILDGVLVIEQGVCRRACRPKLGHRLLLLWTFRNFASLPQIVLANWQEKIIAAVVWNGVAAPLPSKGSSQIIGIVENPMIPAAAGTQPGVDWNLSKVQIAIKRPLELERNAKVLPFAHKKPLRSA